MRKHVVDDGGPWPESRRILFVGPAIQGTHRLTSYLGPDTRFCCLKAQVRMHSTLQKTSVGSSFDSSATPRHIASSKSGILRTIHQPHGSAEGPPMTTRFMPQELQTQTSSWLIQSHRPSRPPGTSQLAALAPSTGEASKAALCSEEEAPTQRTYRLSRVITREVLKQLVVVGLTIVNLTVVAGLSCFS